MMPKERVSRVIEVLCATSHHGFPVIDEINSPSNEEEIPEYGHLKGLILKSQLITLIQKRVSKFIWCFSLIFLNFYFFDSLFCNSGKFLVFVVHIVIRLFLLWSETHSTIAYNKWYIFVPNLRTHFSTLWCIFQGIAFFLLTLTE